MTGYPTNKQQLSAALRSHLQSVSETETAALGEDPIATRGAYFVSSTAPTEDMIVPLVPARAASIVSIDPDTHRPGIWVRYSPAAPTFESQPPPPQLSETRWTGHWCPQLRYAATR